jgi:molybdopterin-guanine dinucleotide biosynthesis protein MobB
MNNQPYVISFYGSSNSGKTTIVEKLVQELSCRGVRVATAKGHLHELEFDHKGTDSWRHARAGAEIAMLAAPNGWMAVHQTDTRVNLDVLIGEATRNHFEVLVVEGFKDALVDKIEVTVHNRDDFNIMQLADSIQEKIAANGSAS